MQRPLSALLRCWPGLVILAVVLAANAVFLLGVTQSDQAGTLAELTADIVPGPVQGQPTLDPNSGTTVQAQGRLAAEEWLAGRVPWWNPYQGLGVPLAGSMQSAAFFPTTLLLALTDGDLYQRIVLEVVGGLATYLLVRRLGVRPWVAVVAGSAFALNGTSAWFQHAAALPVPFLPLLLLGVEQAHDAARRRAWGGTAVVALAVALSLYAGFPETAFLDGLLAAVWVVWRLLGSPRREAAGFAFRALVGVAVGLLLAAPLLLAFGLSLQEAAIGHAGWSDTVLPVAALPQLLMPYAYGPIMAVFGDDRSLFELWASVGGYLTAAVVVLAVLGLAGRHHRGLRVALVVWAALAAGRTYGVPVLGDVLNLLPSADLVWMSRYLAPSLAMVVLVLAALALEDAAGGHLRRWWVAVAALVALVGVGAAARLALATASDVGVRAAVVPPLQASVLWAAGTVVLVAVAVLLLRHAVGKALLVAVLLTDAAVMFVIPQLSAPRSATIDQQAVAFLQEETGPSRVYSVRTLAASYGSYYRIPQVNASDPLLPALFAEYVQNALDPGSPPAFFLGVRFRGGGSPPVREMLENVRGHRNAGVRYLVTPGEEVLPPLADGVLEPALRTSTTAVYRLVGAEDYWTVQRGRCRLDVVSRSRLEADCDGPARLLRRELSFPGWRASVDGADVAVRRSDAFQSVALPAGRSAVAFSYAPPGAGLAGLLALGGALAVLLDLVLARRRPGRAPPEQDADDGPEAGPGPGPEAPAPAP